MTRALLVSSSSSRYGAGGLACVARGPVEAIHEACGRLAATIAVVEKPAARPSLVSPGSPPILVGIRRIGEGVRMSLDFKKGQGRFGALGQAKSMPTREQHANIPETRPCPRVRAVMQSRRAKRGGLGFTWTSAASHVSIAAPMSSA